MRIFTVRLLALLVLALFWVRSPGWRTGASAALTGPYNPIVHTARIIADTKHPAGRKGVLDTRIFQISSSSTHLIQVTGTVPLHYHATYDESVYVLAGKGLLTLGHTAYQLQTGDLVLIPRMVPHAFINQESGGTSVLSFSSPPANPNDTVPVKAIKKT